MGLALRVLFLPNWRVYSEPGNRQAPDYHVAGQAYWFFQHFQTAVDVDVLDIARWPGYRLEDRFLHFYAAQSVAALKRCRDYDVLLVHGAQSAVFLLAIVRAFRLRIPPVVVIDVGAINQGHPEHRASFAPARWALGAASRVVWHSHGSQDMILRHAPELATRGEFVHFGTNASQWAPTPEADEYAVCTGYAFRDYGLLTEAWVALADIPLVVLGVDKESVPGLPGIFPGRVTFRDYQRYVQRARLVVLPVPEGSASYGQMTLLDAFAAGKPVVVTDVSPVRDYLGSWCLSVPSGNAPAFAQAVHRLWNSEVERTRMGQEARRAAENVFTERRMALQLEKILRACTDDSGDSRPSPRIRQPRGLK